MPNSLQSSAIASPASRRATNCSLSSITEHSFQGITPSPLRGKVSPMCPVQCVTYVSGRSFLLSIAYGTFTLSLEQRGVAVVRKNSIRLPSDRDAGSYLFGFLRLRNRKNQSCEQ